jgi:hypothetical protein
VKAMNKIMKFTFILLFSISFVSIPPASAAKHISTHINGFNNASVHQGDSFNEILQVQYYCYVCGLFIGEFGICGLDDNSVYLNIYDANKSEVAHYTIKYPQTTGNSITIDTSNLQPGNYIMTTYFTGEHKTLRTFDPCNKTAVLQVY